jgi:hypothetical protein
MKTAIMKNQNNPEGEHEGHEHNFERYEANHGLENGIDKKVKPLDDDTPEDAVPAQEGDLTSEDLEALGPEDLSMDMGDDEDLKHRTHDVDFSANEMDVPGDEDDDAQEKIGSEDEENNFYSLGGDRHEDAQDDNPDVIR